ncbi:cytochrome ubiquinol oxidase subunit I [Methylobacterium sp. NEAU 140]|uniref:cytochrome ubiquinol oxidase subunit I n=1 Tax=Methylobacterium sp. NEAU 140 TaxID=3064945 RepID=UPI0027350C2C|nr:cytochrome ubiquinol oxidase subunit I [Methylobacterium sp. NEAU 140]MDP4024618.1 cytochrome ubiquinol oxidase subunit I [Methylobacterium sp. NEAU 140]
MDISALMLSRIQFAFTVSFHIIFPAFTVGLAAWLTFLQARAMMSGEPVYDRLFSFWLKIFAVAFGLGVVSGIVMAFQFGTNWSELSRRTGPIQGPLLGYESFTAFALEASFFGVLMFGRNRVPRWFYLFACAMVCLGTSLSSFWILVNNSWMQVPTGYEMRPDGVFVPTDWSAIIFNSVVWVRFPHMILAAYVTTSFCVAATGAWYMLRGIDRIEARAMIRMGLGLACILVPVQLFFGHLTGDYVVKHQPSKIAAIEGHWESQQPAGEIIIAWPDESQEKNLFSLSLPAPIGSLIDTGTTTGKVIGIKAIPKEDRPPVLIPFFAFRIMVGCGLLMLALSWGGMAYYATGRLERARWLQWAIFASFPLGFVATLTGWFTAEVGRQPWTVYGQLRTADAATPILTAPQVATSLAVFFVVYALIFAAGTVYIYRMLKAGIQPTPDHTDSAANPKRPLAVPGGSPGTASATPAE